MFLADKAKTPEPCAFITCTVVTKRVSESAAVIVSISPSRLKRKLSKMGNEFFAAITLLATCRREDNAVLETSNFIVYVFIFYIRYKYRISLLLCTAQDTKLRINLGTKKRLSPFLTGKSLFSYFFILKNYLLK